MCILYRQIVKSNTRRYNTSSIDLSFTTFCTLPCVKYDNRDFLKCCSRQTVVNVTQKPHTRIVLGMSHIRGPPSKVQAVVLLGA